MNIENSKLISLLKTLDKHEFEKLDAYINSPFFNTSEQITGFFELLKEKYPCFTGLNKNSIFKKTYPRQAYNDKKLRDLFSRMLKLAEEFLAQMEFKDKIMLVKGNTLRQLAKKNLEKHFINKVKEAEILFSKEQIISSEFFFNKYSIAQEKRNYLESLLTLGKRNAFFEDITKEIDLFVIYSIYTVLKYGLNLQFNEKILKHKYEFKMLSEVLNYIKANPYYDYPVIMILYYIIILNQGEADDTVYFEVKKLVDENLHLLEEDDQRFILAVLFNYTQTQAIKGKREFRDENYSILKETMEKGLYPREGNYFSQSAYITTVGTALQKKDYKWAETFIDVYKDHLHPDHKENTYNFCISILNYRKGNYKQALEGLAKVSIEDFYFHLRVKNHQIRIFFELEDYEKVLFTVDSFRHFLNSNKLIPDYIKTRFLNYVNFVSRIAHALMIGDPGRKLLEIQEEINRHDVDIENRTWLLEQIEKLTR